MLKIGMGSGSLTQAFGIDEGFAMLREAGFDCADFDFTQWLTFWDVLQGKNESFYDLPLDAQLETLRPYKEAADKHGIRIWQSHAPFPSLVKDQATNEYVWAATRKCIAMCGYLGCKYLIVHPAFLDYDDKLPAQEEWDLNIAMYGAMIDELKQHGVVACLENIYTRYDGRVYDSICCEMGIANRYVDTLNEMAGAKCFGFCLDTGHALLTRNDIYSAVTELGDNLTCLHIHDNDGVKDDHVPPYMGILDWDRFLRGLRDVGYTGCLNFEVGSMFTRFKAPVHRELMHLTAGIGRAFAQQLEG